MLPVSQDAPESDVQYPLRERDGSNPIERKAVYRAQIEIQSMPASLVVQIALWPDKLADWARETGVAAAVVYNMLANVKPYHRVRTLLARRLNVPKSYLDHLIEAPRPEALAKLPPEPPPQDRSLRPVGTVSEERPRPEAVVWPDRAGEAVSLTPAALRAEARDRKRSRRDSASGPAQTALNL